MLVVVTWPRRLREERHVRATASYDEVVAQGDPGGCPASPARYAPEGCGCTARPAPDRKSTRLNSSHVKISYAVFCLKKTTLILGECFQEKLEQIHFELVKRCTSF